MPQRGNGRKPELVVVAIDKDKGSQSSMKWTVENLLTKGKSVILLHVKIRPPSPVSDHDDLEKPSKVVPIDSQTKGLFLPFRCFCNRKDIQVSEVVVEDTDVARALCDYTSRNLIEHLVVCAPVRNTFFRRFKNVDIPGTVSRGVPGFCTVYVIAKGKVSSIKSATIPVPKEAPRSYYNTTNSLPGSTESRFMQGNGTRGRFGDRQLLESKSISPREADSFRSPFLRGKYSNKSYGDFSIDDTDISFVSSSSGGSSTERMNSILEHEMSLPPHSSNSSDTGSPFSHPRSSDGNSSFGLYSSSSLESSGSQILDDVEAEMRRLKQELRQTMELYSTAYKEALTAKQKAEELNRWKLEEEQRLREAQLAEEAAVAMAYREKIKCKAAIAKAEVAERIAEHESQRRINAEKKALLEAEETKKVLNHLSHNDVRYRKYSIDEIEVATNHFAESRKIGEGGYGPVYEGYLDHTQVAIKVLRPDAAQGRSQFQQEVEVLSRIRHPNMVLLLGACPEYGCLVYEYMANRSLEDRLFCKVNTPVLRWQVRFRIAAEIGTGLLFLHQAKPEPLVHRDLKPGNILLDRNLVSKIGDVGLARLVPPTLADTVTQYRMTSTAGTFCYIDPEYQQTGMLGIKSDIYSLGVMLLQLITAKPPMGLTHHVENSIDNGTLEEMLDPEVLDWPVEEVLSFAKLALKCTELRRKDRPDLATEILPELNRLRELSEQSISHFSVTCNPNTLTDISHSHSEVIESEKLYSADELESTKARSG